MPPEKLSEDRVYQIKVTLRDTKPPIWRRVLLPGSTSLSRLHFILQAVMGWQNGHLHMFKVNEVEYGDPIQDPDNELGFLDEGRATMSQLALQPGASFEYVYDFGDTWDHLLQVEAVLPPDESGQLPRCTAGKRACPPEDVGGTGGYYVFLEAIQDPLHPEHENFLEWSGSYDPEKFDLQTVNARLSKLSDEPASHTSGLAAMLDEFGLVRIHFTSLMEWTLNLNAEFQAIAEALPLRRDMVTLLTYLREHKVTGTQVSGNLPLKAGKEIVAGFVHPPEWDHQAGDIVFKTRSSEHVWPLYFLVVLAQVGNLVTGGPARRFRLTPGGEAFLSASAPLQIWYAHTVWWTQVNWLIAYPYEAIGEFLPYGFTHVLMQHLMNFEPGEKVAFRPFADRLIQETGLEGNFQDKIHAQEMLHYAVRETVVEPLSNLGVVALEPQTEEQQAYRYRNPPDFRVTPFGRSLLETFL